MGVLLRDILSNQYTRLLLLISVAVFTLCFGFIGFTYYLHIEGAKKQELARLQAIARTTVCDIRADELAKVLTAYPTKDAIKTNAQDSLYQNIHSQLERSHKNNLLLADAPIYTLAYDSLSQHFFFGVASSPNPFYRHTYPSFPKALRDHYMEGTGGYLDVYEDDHGMWLSAFEPIKDQEGRVISMLQVDKNFMDFIMEARSEAIKEVLLMLGLFIVFGVFIYRTIQRFIEKEKQTKQELKSYSQLIEQKNQNITDSIHYAKKIQDSILPDKSLLTKGIEDAFVLYLPKDIVSGDFYWCLHKGHLSFLATVDCTGHGVPGAFMSMTGNSLLFEAINEKGLTKPAEILQEMELGLRRSLNKELDGKEETQDGMDMSLICIDHSNQKLSFAGARRPLIHVRDGKLEEIKGCKRSIGNAFHKTANSFEEHCLSIHKGDQFYMFSDGYPDQFGGPKGKKFMSRNFKNTLLEISTLPSKEQKMALKQQLEDWKNGLYEQVDDVLVMGIKI